MAKSKGWKLPRNWADQLTLEEAQNIRKHWVSRVSFWEWHEAMDDLDAARHLQIVKSRVVLWDEIIERKRNGERCQDLIAVAAAGISQ
jgi:hypothetical protein